MKRITLIQVSSDLKWRVLSFRAKREIFPLVAVLRASVVICSALTDEMKTAVDVEQLTGHEVALRR